MTWVTRTPHPAVVTRQRDLGYIAMARDHHAPTIPFILYYYNIWQRVPWGSRLFTFLHREGRLCTTKNTWFLFCWPWCLFTRIEAMHAGGCTSIAPRSSPTRLSLAGAATTRSCPGAHVHTRRFPRRRSACAHVDAREMRHPRSPPKSWRRTILQLTPSYQACTSAVIEVNKGVGIIHPVHEHIKQVHVTTHGEPRTNTLKA